MKFIDYINGRRHGREANRLERDAMRDPLLQDALEGFDAIEGDHTEALRRLMSRVPSDGRQTRRRHEAQRWLMAAACVGVVATGCWMLWKNHGNRDPMMVAQEVVEEENAPVFRVVPEVIIEAADKAESVDEIVSVIAENIQIVDNNADIETETIQMFADMSNEEVEISQDSDSILTLDEVAFTGSAPVASEVSLRHNRREMLEKSIAAPTSVHAVSADSLRAAEAFRRYLDEVSHTLEGRVTLEFWSDGNGRPTKIRVVDGLSVSRKAKQAAISLLRESPIVWPPRKTMKVVLE